jgi:hypothetical protein
LPAAATIERLRLPIQSRDLLSALPFFAPLCLSVLNQLEEALRGIRICSVRAKLLFELPFCWAHNKEAQRIEHFVGQWISEVFHTPAYCADRYSIPMEV